MKTSKSIIAIILLVIFACKNENENNKFSGKLSKIDNSEIEIVEIKKEFSDTISVKLDSEQIKNVVDLINESGQAELLKAGPRYWLLIKLKNDSIKAYKINDNYFGENDLYIRLKDKGYFKNIYENNIKSNSLIDCRIK
jgi:hypothetical protein